MTLKQITRAIVALAVVAASSAAMADSFGLPNFNVFGTRSVTINDALNETTTCVGGNVGTGGTAAAALRIDKCLVGGSIYVATAPVLSLGSHGAYAGSQVLGSQSSVGATMSTVSHNLSVLTPNQTLTSLVMGTGGSMTFTNASTTGGVFVINVNGTFDLNGSTLNFVAGNAADTFIINIGGGFAFSQSVINLSGGITANQLIFNITDACGLAEVNKGTSVWEGTILAPNCDVRVHNDLDFTGRLFGQNVTVDSGVVLGNPPPEVATPEPGTLLFLASGVTGLGAYRKRIFRSRN